MNTNFTSRHSERDSALPVRREELLERALSDLTSDEHVIGIYLGGSLAKGNSDNYSDIDLHIIVKPDKKNDFISDKRSRSRRWGEVLFFEDSSAASPVVVTHYDCFVKIDSWYHSPDELQPSIWLNGIISLYDPHQIVQKVLDNSARLEYTPSSDEVSFWRRKMLAFSHETYRAAMRMEIYYALSNLDRMRWLMVSGWYMEMGAHLDGSYGVWSKLEGSRSLLKPWQLTLLASWESRRDPKEIMKTMTSMVPEFLRVNDVLSKQTGIINEQEHIKKILDLVI